MYQGRHADAEVSLRLLSNDARYTGTLTIGSHQYSVRASPTPGQLTGEFFDENGTAASFVCRIDPKNDILIIQRADGDVHLNRVPVPENIWGHWQGEGIDLFLSQTEGAEAIRGMIFFQGGKFPLTGQYQLGKLEGMFQSAGEAYPFTVQTQAVEKLHFISGPFAQELTRQTSDSIWKAHQSLMNEVGVAQAMKPLLPYIRQEVVAAMILMEELQNQLAEAESDRDALSWAGTIERYPEMTQKQSALQSMVSIFKPKVAAQLMNEAAEIMDDHPTEAQKKEAFDLMLQAAEMEDPGAMLLIGHYYQNGLGVEANYPEAIRWYRQAAKLDHAVAARTAQNNLGTMYFHGQGVPQDWDEAIRWLQLSVDNGNPNAENSLKIVAEHIAVKALDIIENNPTEAQKTKAFGLMLKAAECGQPIAMLLIGRYYVDAVGVEQNYKNAIRWYQRSAEFGNKTAQYELGLMYYQGQGVSPNQDEAIKWLQRAADNGSTDAAKFLKDRLSKKKATKKEPTKTVTAKTESDRSRNTEATTTMGRLIGNPSQ